MPFIKLRTIFWTFAKGQLISIADWRAIDSTKNEPTNLFVCLSAFLLFKANKSNSSVRFLGESTARQSAFLKLTNL
jgi:hypothetical protein